MAKASSNDILALRKPLGSGPGAIRQFWNPIKRPGEPLRSGQGAIRQFWNPIKPERGASRSIKEGQGWGIEGGAMHPSVLEAQSKSEAVVQLTVALKESNVPHLRWSQAPPCLGQGEAGPADIYIVDFNWYRLKKAKGEWEGESASQFV